MTDHTIVYARGRFDGLLLFFLIVSLTANLALGYRLATTKTGPADGRPEPPSVGAALPDLTMETMQGTAEQIKFGAGQPSTLLYVFAPACTWCARNLDNLRALSVGAKNSGVRFVGLSLDPDVEDYVRREKLDFPIYVRPDSETLKAYGLGVTPQTFWISGDGRLQGEWRGAHTGEIKNDLEKLFNLTLPGLIARNEISGRQPNTN